MIDHEDPHVSVALLLVGAWYRWGGGHGLALDAWDYAGLQYHGEQGRGYDCSGSVVAYATVAGDIRPGSVNTNAHGLAMKYLDAIDEADAGPGDFTLYDRNDDGVVEHIGIYIGDGMEVTMSGGGRTTLGDNPQARGQVRPVRDPLCYARWKTEYTTG